MNSVLTTSLRNASRTYRGNSLSQGLFCFVRPKPIVWRRPTTTPSRSFTASFTEQSRPPSLVQFLASRFLQATHRSGAVSSSRSRSPFTPPPDPQGPWRRFIRWLDSLPSNAIFWGVLVINGAVFASWQLATALYQSSGSRDLYILMNENFTVSMRNIRSGRIWTLVTSAFSHAGIGHILVNAFTYYFMAPPVLALLGNSGFLALYLGGGMVSSLTSLWWNSYKGNQFYSSHGASGAVYSVITFFACVAPNTQFAIFGIIPCPAWLFVSGIFVWDAYESMRDSRTQVDNAGHVGGIIGGIGYYLRKRFRIF
ncbi:hypothetical protein PHLGIDRAFT_97577 [Phlebiopsis gigantea 11061_1 CR5-6]|uniref:Peptidase S54 rhomboid domain-containing protein n=1 Tax=Phlebiopsis gigantea (strain 11061_1 CR5-6) TaxID=745531 RepID=A0A0C3P4E9_PHLG1|nr:hypothetical protein PHLGIDRAFT_97577 [Phlebiopsis gigantea 11061_1 CR5-6]